MFEFTMLAGGRGKRHDCAGRGKPDCLDPAEAFGRCPAPRVDGGCGGAPGAADLSLTLPVLRCGAPAQSSGAMAFFRVFSNGRAGASAPRSAGHGAASAAALRRRQHESAANRLIAAWAAGACFGLLQMLFACAALRRLRRGARLGLPDSRKRSASTIRSMSSKAPAAACR